MKKIIDISSMSVTLMVTLDMDEVPYVIIELDNDTINIMLGEGNPPEIPPEETSVITTLTIHVSDGVVITVTQTMGMTTMITTVITLTATDGGVSTLTIIATIEDNEDENNDNKMLDITIINGTMTVSMMTDINITDNMQDKKIELDINISEDGMVTFKINKIITIQANAVIGGSGASSDSSDGDFPIFGYFAIPIVIMAWGWVYDDDFKNFSFDSYGYYDYDSGFANYSYGSNLSYATDNLKVKFDAGNSTDDRWHVESDTIINFDHIGINFNQLEMEDLKRLNLNVSFYHDLHGIKFGHGWNYSHERDDKNEISESNDFQITANKCFDGGLLHASFNTSKDFLDKKIYFGYHKAISKSTSKTCNI